MPYQEQSPLPEFPQQADIDLYRSLVTRYSGSDSAVARYAEKVVGHVQGHRGGPSLFEQRCKWDELHPSGPSGRTYRPDDFAFAFAADVWGDAQADAQCAALGLHPDWLRCVRHRFRPDAVELRQLAANARVFTREMLGALIRAQLPGKLCEAATPGEWQRIVGTAVRLPGWVLDGAAAEAQPAPEPVPADAPPQPVAAAAAPERVSPASGAGLRACDPSPTPERVSSDAHPLPADPLPPSAQSQPGAPAPSTAQAAVRLSLRPASPSSAANALDSPPVALAAPPE